MYLKRGNDHNRGKCPEKGGSNRTYTVNIEQLKGGPWSPGLLGAPDLQGGTSHPSSYHAFNLASDN